MLKLHIGNISDKEKRMETKKLIDCCEFISDGDHLPPPKSDSGVPFITISNITGQNKLSFEDTMFVPESYYNGLNENKKAQKGDILYSVVGSFGKPVYVDFDKQMVFQRHIAILRPKRNVNARFIYYTMLNPQFYKLVDKLAIGCSQRTVTLDTLRNIEVNLPDKDIQDKMVGILSLIDEKIDINNNVNDNLEQQIQLIFDYLFPDVCAGNKHMGDFIIPKRGKSLLSKNAVHGNVPVIAGGLEPSIYHNVANTIAPVVTISSSGANAGFVNIWGVPVWSSDSSYIDSEMSRYVYFWYAYLKRHQNNIYNIQTGSAQPHIYPSHISSLPITDLDYKKIENYTEIVSPIFSTITKNHVENQHLQSLRDWLLPMLMNGQATIND